MEASAPLLDTFSLRPAADDDGQFLYRLYKSTRVGEMQAWGWPAEQQDMFLKMQFDARRRAYQAEFPVAEESIVLIGDAPVGALRINQTAEELRLIDIALLPEFRNRGLGGRLIARLIESDVPVALSVARENPAKRLYERMGFVVEREDAMYFEMRYKDPS